jgi:hypothetical protein
LKHVVVRVDEAWHHHVSAKIDDFVRCFRQFGCGPNGDDPWPFRVQPPVLDFPALFIERYKDIGVPDKQGGHGPEHTRLMALPQQGIAPFGGRSV